MASENLPAPVEERPQPAIGQRGIMPRNLDELGRLAAMLHKSKMVPSSFKTVESVGVVMLAGMEAGISPIQAVRVMYAVNGMCEWRGTGALAQMHNSPRAEWIESGCRGEGEDMEGWCRAKIKGHPGVIERTFSVAEAKKAGLWQGNYNKFPKDMLEWRAVGRMASRYFSAELCGMGIAEDEWGREQPAAEREVRDVTPPADDAPPAPAGNPLMDVIAPSPAAEAAPANLQPQEPIDIDVSGGPPPAPQGEEETPSQPPHEQEQAEPEGSPSEEQEWREACPYCERPSDELVRGVYRCPDGHEWPSQELLGQGSAEQEEIEF